MHIREGEGFYEYHRNKRQLELLIKWWEHVTKIGSSDLSLFSGLALAYTTKGLYGVRLSDRMNAAPFWFLQRQRVVGRKAMYIRFGNSLHNLRC